MLSYEDFAAQHNRVLDAAKSAELKKYIPSNLTGQTPSEAISHLIGAYVTHIVNLSKSATELACHLYLSQAAGALIALCRHLDNRCPGNRYDDPSDVDEVTISICNSQLADFCRMNPTTFVGYAMSYVDFSVKDRQDAYYWASIQFDLLSKYAYTHDFDLVYLIGELR